MNRDIKREILQIFILIVATLLINYLSADYVKYFEHYIFIPFQVFRCWLFNFMPFSVGDVFYLVLICIALYTCIKTLKNIRSYKKINFFKALLKITKVALFFNLLLLLLWGIKYEQPKLAYQLNLSTDSVSKSDLIIFDSLLIQRLNFLQQSYRVMKLKEINVISALVYNENKTPIQVFAKQTLMGNGLAYFGIEGYYNPFSGEAQVNKMNPDFMQPFIVAHEMAHQAGIAAEDDANLLAYIRCIESGDKTFQYSAYFNIWLYTHRKVLGIDSSKANALKAELNTISLAQIDTLHQRRIKYHTVMDDISSFIFDIYLKLGNQTEGISTYRNVVYSAIAWERKKRMNP